MNKENPEIKENLVLDLSFLIKLGMCLWISAVFFIFIILFGPPHFWVIAERIGVYDWLVTLVNIINPFFSDTRNLLCQH